MIITKPNKLSMDKILKFAIRHGINISNLPFLIKVKSHPRIFIKV